MGVRSMSVTIWKNVPAIRRESNKPILNRDVGVTNAEKFQKLYCALHILDNCIIPCTYLETLYRTLFYATLYPMKAASRVLRRLFAEIERRTDPVTIQINQSKQEIKRVRTQLEETDSYHWLCFSTNIVFDSIDYLSYLDHDDSGNKYMQIGVGVWPIIDLVNLDLNSKIPTTMYRKNGVKKVISIL
ncbi:hypothetical protein V1478_000110 [Vespula squamosa]|uniref:Uncharacterized protein n=1 Tax=Vespula squamosa TaxID=30214 RepID=A0ABD2C905_VESSQ